MIGYWNFNEGSGPLVSDISGNNNGGQIVGADWVNDGVFGISSSEFLYSPDPQFNGTDFSVNKIHNKFV